jgi:hypothetical protein
MNNAPTTQEHQPFGAPRFGATPQHALLLTEQATRWQAGRQARRQGTPFLPAAQL